MCGIVGFSGDFSPHLLKHSSESIAHRGPDAEGSWVDSMRGIGLGHRRLSILDLSPAGAQPMHSEDGSVVLVFNGEIYNFRELRIELEAIGHRFKGHSDTEILLHLYLVYGEKMLGRLNGIFAFALWDKRNQSLFVARDALGVKPLYFSETVQGFVFASELKGLLQLSPQLKELDIPSLHRYLSFLWCPGEGTPLRDVRKLLPGEAMSVKSGKIAHRWTWYQLPIFREIKANLSETEAITRTTTLLRQAVQRQLVADVPVGAFLSGGLDSSAIVALARETVPDIRCFTIETIGGQDPGTTDDLPYARRVAQHLNVPLDVVKIEANQMAFDLEKMIAQLDEPLADLAPLNVLYISQLAREQGIKVLLSGTGGDDLFTGYRRHLAVNYQAYWNWLPLSIRKGLEQASNQLSQQNPLFRRLTKLFNGAGLNGDSQLINYFSWAKEADLMALYTPEFRASLGSALAADPMLDFLKPLSSAVKPLDKMLALEQRFFLADHNLTYTDKMSMAVGVEVRVPFLDLDLVAHAAQIPLHFKQHGTTGKWVLKKAMESFLPNDIISRPKSGFGVPLRRWMQHELRHLLEDYLSEKSLKRRGLFDYVAVQKLVAKNDSGQVDAAYTLLSLLSIEIWCRAYLD